MNEIVLVASLDLGLSHGAKLAVIILVSGAGRVAGSIFVSHIGHQTKESGYVERVLERLSVDVMDWTEREAIQTAQNWGFVGLAAALCVPSFPDVLSTYASSALEDSYPKLTVATFVGFCGRPVVTVIGIEAALAFL